MSFIMLMDVTYNVNDGIDELLSFVTTLKAYCCGVGSYDRLRHLPSDASDASAHRLIGILSTGRIESDHIHNKPGLIPPVQ